ncbi:hypothetical protein [Parageobacillus thermoglucosidasius]|uniref:Uncharacterized protein n=1 Tax=Parageobacillus thermoglucosidasius TaxID=1426 RepID=A0AAN0YQ69_PARTM|nr:hypothetical protein [Parageobacillus thermoglucosidasius]ALF10811.1 hypothetical protein AOT13_12720 [Parageobacillus thermoglucosidasius]ANZ30889.1 hypothetical protein BCV53_12730 [Parageobacillus thermoglucosidasius]APM81626.1 hypothetical protein BCV54_12740 [Parageobacillus thermoglucosidasius]KJX67636.1 hypothetical protein WH82_16710 [Parageobacillus thermoglucosidasius]RDE22217.1 hypothetical protein DV712_19445 [Parageobacillus thermoglucosidasius]
MEKTLNKYVIDVLFEGDDNYLVIEICVTHRMEEEKRSYLINHNIPFIEVLPSKNNNGYSYTVCDLYLPGFLEQYEEDAVERQIQTTYEYFREELLRMARKEILNKNQLELYQQEVLDQVSEKIDCINLRDHIDSVLYKKMHSIPVIAYNANPIRFEEFSNARYINSKTIKINNGRYFLNREQNILYNLLQTFQKEGIKIHAIVCEDEFHKHPYVGGFNFLIPSSRIIGEQIKEILKKLVLEARIDREYIVEHHKNSGYPF